MSIFKIFAMLICVLVPASVAHCGIVPRYDNHAVDNSAKIKYVTIKQFHESDFKVVADYFGGQNKHKYFRCTAVDDESKSEGTYFIVGLNESVKKLPAELFVKIYTIASLKEGVREFTCKVSDNRHSITSEIYCGITSIPLDILKIRAWRIEIIDGEGNILCTSESYMWR